MDPDELIIGQTYSFEAIGQAFGMKPAVLTWQGGIISRPDHDALLVITKPDLESIDYHDYWEGEDLVYGARGQRGNQELSGVNQTLGANGRRNFVFEALGNATMRYRGIARCMSHWWAQAPDVDGNDREVIRFLLRFGNSPPDQVDDLVDTLASNHGPEGRRRIRQHTVLERNRGLVSDAKRHWRRIDPLLRCEVCKMSFVEVYGVRGEHFIEAHHRVPLGQLDAEVRTRIVDLAPVCSNCHRMLHRGDECTTQELRAELRPR